MNLALVRVICLYGYRLSTPMKSDVVGGADFSSFFRKRPIHGTLLRDFNE